MNSEESTIYRFVRRLSNSQVIIICIDDRLEMYIPQYSITYTGKLFLQPK